MNLADDMSLAMRVCVLSVGSAQPYAAKVIAAGFHIEPEEAVRCIYRAPSVLVEDVDPIIANELVSLLSDVGLEVVAQPMSDEPPPPQYLYDVSVYLHDERRATEAATTIGDFMGASGEQVLELVRTPPAVILGGVSEATVQALANRLDGVAELVKSRPEDATFSIILTASSALMTQRLLKDLRRMGIEPLADEGLLARQLPSETIREVWQRHGPSGSIMVVNESFLRFNIVLQQVSDRTLATKALQRLAGIPATIVDQVIDSAPITLNLAVATKEVEPLLTQYSAAGIVATADMNTFQQEVLKITECPDRTVLDEMLGHMGFEIPGTSVELPFMIPAALGELDARMWKTALEDAGLGVEYCEVC